MNDWKFLMSFCFVLNNKLKDHNWIYWKRTNSKQSNIIVCLKLQKQVWVMHFFSQQNPTTVPTLIVYSSTLYTLSKERVGRLKHFSISCMLPQNRATARCAVLKHQHCIQKTIFYLFIYYKHTVRTVNDVVTFWVE